MYDVGKKEMEEMFCFQCQQTAHNTGCEGHTGVCGKKSDTANLQDELTGELIRLARAVTENERSRSSDELMLKRSVYHDYKCKFQQ